MSRRVADTTLTNLAIQGCAAVTGVILARLLGVNGRGDLAAAMVWPTMIAGIAILGTDVAFARFAAAGQGRLRQIFHAMAIVTVVVSTPVMIVGYHLLPLLLPDAKANLLPVAQLLLLAVPLGFAAVLCVNVALGIGKHFFFNSIRLSFNVAYLAGIAGVAALTQPTVLSTAICFLAATFITASYGLLAMHRQMVTRDGPALRAREIVSSAAPFGLVTVGQALIVNIPVALLTVTVSSSDVGYFVVAMSASGAHATLGSAIGKILFAKVSRGPDARIWIGSLFRQALLLYAFLAVALACALPYLIPMIFGNHFWYSGQLAIGLVISTSLTNLSSVLEEALRAKGWARQIILGQFVGAACLFALATVLLPQLGLPAMIWACICGAAMQFMVIVLALSQALGLPWRDLVAVRNDDMRALVLRVRSILPSSRGERW